MNWADFAILGIIFVSILISLVRGFVREAISLTSWVLAAVLGMHFCKPLSAIITFTEVASLKLIFAFLIVFVSIVFIGAIVNYLIGKVISKTPFTMPDRILGIFFGAFRGVIVTSLIILFAGLTPFPQDKWWQASLFVPKLQTIATWMQAQLPDEIGQRFDFNKTESEEPEVATGPLSINIQLVQ